MITCSDVDVSGDDGSGRIAGYASVELGVNVLLVIFGAERRENQTARCLNLQQLPHNSDVLGHHQTEEPSRCHDITKAN
jgi:hypothetical protein